MTDSDNYVSLKDMGVTKSTDIPEFDLLAYTHSRYTWFLDGVVNVDLNQFDIIFTYSHN